MLRRLYIRNFALIDEIDTSFERGLNVITGETGAGKSILLGALKLLLGARSSTELVRTGETKAIVEGVFDVEGRDDIQMLLKESDLDTGLTLIVRREVTRDQSRAFVNDSPVRLEILRDIADSLVDLHGQHDHQSILRNDTHLPLLDGFGDYAGDLEAYRSVFDQFQRLHQERQRLIDRRQELARDRDLAEFQIGEIDAVQPKPDEEQALEDELKILDHIEQLVDGSRRAFEVLYSDDESVYDRISLVLKQLEDLQRFDENFGPYVTDLKGGAAAIAEVASYLRDYAPATDFDPRRADEVRDRLGALETLKRKYGGSIEAVLEHRRRIGELFDEASNFDDKIQCLDAEIAELQPRLGRQARDLSGRRIESASRLRDTVVEELGRLGMQEVQFEISFSTEVDRDGWVEDASGDRVRAREHGIDTCEFLLSANRGEPPKPLVKVASGGEASRIMLALKSILARGDKVATLVFDEIDTGISGAIAERVGKAMHDLAQSHQIITITHLPQIAAAADTHYVVRKDVVDGRTTTVFARIDGDDRTREVAALLSGAEISSAALESARELIGR